MNSMPRGLPEAHPAAELFPLMNDDELQVLIDDIREHSQLHPIVMTEGKILDGRNRFLASVVAHKKPWIVQWEGGGNPASYVISANLKRRHLTPGQRAAIAVAALPFFEEEARARKIAGGRVGARNRKDGDKPSPSRPRDASGRAVAQAAKATGAGIVATNAMRAIKEAALEIFDRAKAGDVSVAEARRQAGLRVPKPAPESKRRSSQAPPAAEAAPSQAMAPVATPPVASAPPPSAAPTAAARPPATSPRPPTATPEAAPAPSPAPAPPSVTPVAAPAPSDPRYERVLAEALALPRDDRRRLGEALLASLERVADGSHAG